jgi:ABC-2 type transport system permease protein
MKKIWAVIRREFVERVRSRWFIVSTVLGPVFVAGVLVVPVVVGSRGARERSVAVLDVTTTGFGARVTGDLDRARPVRAVRVPADVTRLEPVADSLAEVVAHRMLDGFLIITDETVGDGRAEYRGSNVSSLRDMEILSNQLEESALTERLAMEGVDPAAVRRARVDVRLSTSKVGGPKGAASSGEGSFILAYLMWFLLYVAIILYGVSVMGSVVEEKTSRVIEVVISSVRPFQLLAGKILGVGAVGLLQFGIWLGFGMLLRRRQADIMQLFGATPEVAAATGLPPVSAITITIFLLYFLLGYFLYAAMFAAVAAMSSTEAEARQAQTPVVMLLVVPTVLMIGILNDPDGTLAVMLGLIPFFSPIAMPVRWAAAPIPLAEVFASLALLVLAVFAVTWLASRIFRIGILMYGKRPSLVEVWRWVRTD